VATTFDVLAEPTRRRILDLLLERPRPVAELTEVLGLTQPGTSKHLRVLREAGVVAVRDEGRRRLYRVNGEALKPIHEWVSGYARLWDERFDRIDDVLEELKATDEGADGR
jgi:DNA-binding transcriptional ArsR family regulator